MSSVIFIVPSTDMLSLSRVSSNRCIACTTGTRISRREYVFRDPYARRERPGGVAEIARIGRYFLIRSHLR